MVIMVCYHPITAVAPVRERGLKCWSPVTGEQTLCRSRKGAWIEMLDDLQVARLRLSRSRKGAWIEICRFLTH